MLKLNSIEELDQFMQGKGEAILFKHSTTCPISAGAYEEFMRYVKGENVKPWALVIVQEARPVSNEIAERFGVKHESPQVLYVKDGNVVWHASHWNITEKELEKKIP
jgi:bacillithiol system protein YtxJ